MKRVTKMLALNYDKGTPGQKALFQLLTVATPGSHCFVHTADVTLQCNCQITGTITVSVSCWECISLAHEPLAKIVAS